MSETLKSAQTRLSAAASTLTGGMVGGTSHNFPAFDDLPKVQGEPQGSLWGFFDKNGEKDEIGSTFICAISVDLKYIDGSFQLLTFSHQLLSSLLAAKYLPESTSN